MKQSRDDNQGEATRSSTQAIALEMMIVQRFKAYPAVDRDSRRDLVQLAEHRSFERLFSCIPVYPSLGKTS